jgi:hypothetical protein
VTEIDPCAHAWKSHAPANTPAPGTSTTIGDVTIATSTVKPENVEIRFAEKPAPDVRAELKAAGFRWMARDACWYGPRAFLPVRYAGVSP